MAELKAVRFGNGAVTFIPSVPETPATTKKDGNITINTIGQPGQPSRYEVSFMLACDFEEAGVEISNVFHLSALVLGEAHTAPYRTIEAKAARELAPMLRAVAQQIEVDVAAFDKKASETP